MYKIWGVNLEDKILYEEDLNYGKVWLSRRDCINLTKKCIEAKQVPHNFMVLYGVSDDIYRTYVIFNPFGWKPIDGYKLKKK